MLRKSLLLIILLLTLVIPAYGLTRDKPAQGAGPVGLLQGTPVSPTPTNAPPRPQLGVTPVPADNFAPIVVDRSPRRGQSLPPDAAVELVFDRPMDQETVAEAFSLQLAAEQSEPVSGQISWVDEQTLQFTPADALPRDTTYDAILTQAARSADGDLLGEPYTFRFMTAGFLEVAQVIPEAGTIDIETNPTITVIFNRPVVPLTSLAEAENLPQPLAFDPEVEGSGEWLNTSIYVFRPEEALAGGTTYSVNVEGGLEDISGAILADDFQWQFTTQPPEVVWSSPQDGAVQVPVDTTVSVQFNQPIDPDAAIDAFSLNSGALFGGGVDGDFKVDNQTLTFTPTEQLDFDQTYTLNIEAGVTSAEGGEGMRQAYGIRFTTVPLPRIVDTFPRNGDRRAPPHTDFRIIFNAPIDPATVMPNLTMTPPLSPTQVYTYFSQHDNTFGLSFGARPSTDYRVEISDGIADPYGNTIPQGRIVEFRTDALPPNFQLRLPQPIGTYDASRPARVIVGHTNVNRLNLDLYRLDEGDIATPPWNWYEATLDNQQRMRSWSLNLENPLDQQTFTAIDLTESGGALEPGLYLLEANAPEVDLANRQPYRPRHLLVVSDLNLTLKVGPKEALVWATDLESGAPVSGLDITFYEYDRGSIGQATTDADGVARVEIPQSRYVALAVSEDPFAAVGSDWGYGISPWDFGMGQGEYSQDFRSYIYTDRPIYRPGQTIYFKGVVRSEDDASFRLPDLGQVQVIVRDAAYNEIFNDSLSLSEAGAFNGSVTLEEGAALGNYTISVDFANHYFEQYVQVAAYRPPEFEVIVTPDVAEARRGETISATIEARYLFGGALAEAPIQWNVLAEQYRFKPPQAGSYSFDDVNDPYACYDCWWWWEAEPFRQPILSGAGQTGPDGTFSLALDGEELAEALPTGAQRIIIEATATGQDNQFISGRNSVIVHPGPYYIGLSPQEHVADAGQETGIDIVVVDWAGERLPEMAVQVEFIHREWVNTFVEYESGGGYWNWDIKETSVATTSVTTDDLGEAIANFTPPEGGTYQVVATPVEPTTTTENIRAAIFIWVAGEENVSWRRENHDRITLISDKTTYSVGETAEILIPSPFEAPHYALLTVERGRIIRHEVIELETNSHIYRLPITEGDAPNIYLSAVLVKGRAEEALADFKMGLLPLDVDLAGKTLTLNIETDTGQAEPGQEVTYTVTATGPDGEPVEDAELSLDLVDKAVLNLQPRSHDILSGFYARRSLQINTASGLIVSANRLQEELEQDLDFDDAVEEQAMPTAEGVGGAAFDTADMVMEEAEAPAPTAQSARQFAANVAVPEGLEVRQEFADTAFWEPLVTTDQDGQATVTIELPDNLTTWVMRGVGLTGGTIVGEQTSDLVSTKPLLIRPVTPRFFVVEDRAQLAANVSNNTDDELSVEVTLSAEGVNIDLDTPPQQTIDIPARSEARVTWDVVVDDVTEAQLVFSAVSGDLNDSSRPRLTTGPDGSLLVLRYTAPDIVGTAGQLIDGGSVVEAIALPPNVDTRRGQLSLQLDPSLAAGMRDGLDYLEHFPYECTEQTVSRFLPNILTYNALQSLGIENEELAERLPGLVDEGLEKLYLQQNPDGGWGWWHNAENPRSNPYVSSYVVFALLKAQQTDIDVSDEVLARGLNYVQAQVMSPQDYRHTRHANLQAWLLYVLAEGDTARQSDLDALYDSREKLSHYARAYLAQALWLDDPNDSRLATLLSDLNNAAILSATGAHWEENFYDWWAMNTDTRSTAIIIDTLTKLDPGNALIPNAVRWLMVARRGGIWETTQETAWSLIALTDWMLETGELEADYDFNADLNGDEIAAGQATPENVQESTKIKIPVAELVTDATNTLTIARSDGNGRLYYTAHVEIYQPVEELEPAERGIFVSRRYTLASCEDGPACPEVREAKLGDVIRVDLTIIAPNDLYYVVVEDPLPAGGEAIDTGLATTSLLAMDPTLTRQNSRYWWWWRWYSRSELRDEKVVLFADVLSKGTYEYSYTFRATLPGDYHVIPTVAQEMYFPEVFGRSDGRLLSIGE